jgi:ABC-type polysaccharide/polyol phosphate export permease
MAGDSSLEGTRSQAAAAPDPVAEPRLSVAQQLADVARQLWSARELLAQITLRDVRIRYTQAVMGFGWAVLMPVLIVAAGLLIRLAMAHVADTEVTRADALGIAVKAMPWAFFVGALSFATTSLTGNYQLVTKVAFPRIVLPISAVLVQACDTAIGSLALLVLLPFLGGAPSAAWLWIPLLALLAFMLTTAACVFVSCANLFFRDVKYLVQVLLSFGIFFTPVFFEPQMLGDVGGRLLMLNPLSPVLEGLRLCVTQGHDLSQTLRVASGDATLLVWTPWYLVWASGVAGVLFVGSTLLFRRLEHLFAEYA